jgi:hypothetical protein
VVSLSTFETIDNEEEQMFFLLLHSITSASHFEHLVTLCDVDIDEQRLQAGRRRQPSFPICASHNIVSVIKHCKDFHIGWRIRKLVTQFLKRMSTERRAEKV